MRALCGAIITAGALIGFGLFSIGVGNRYADFRNSDPASPPVHVGFDRLDTALMVTLVALVISLIIGLGVAFVGLAYHHHRRHHELQHLLHGHRPVDPAAGAPSPRVGV